jgi:glycerol transport system permease protein
MKKIKWVVPTFYIIFLMLPIYWLLNMSFKSTTEIINVYSLWPQDFTLDNYRTIFTDSTWYMGYVNSITYTVFNTIISVSCSTSCCLCFFKI